VVILAAGKATRMESRQNKMLHLVAGRPMLEYVLDSARRLQPSKVAVVIGHQGEKVRRAFSRWSKIHWVRQAEMRGTGDAVRSAAGVFRSFDGQILVLYGDIPGIREETLRRLIMVHGASKNAVTLLTSEMDDPTGYGRIILDADGSVARIVEEKDATDEEREIYEVNTGIGIYDARFLFGSVKLLRPTNKQKEYYLTDLVDMAKKQGKGVGRFRIRDNFQVIGINDRESLAEVSHIFYENKALDLLKSGVTLEDPASTIIEQEVEIGPDTVVGGQTRFRGHTRVGSSAEIGAGGELVECDIDEGVRIGRNVRLLRVKIGTGSVIGSNTTVGTED